MVDLITTTHALAQSHPEGPGGKDKTEKNMEAIKLQNEKMITECQGRASLYGLSTGAISFAVVYFGQKYFSRQWKNRQMAPIIVSSLFFGGMSAYLISTAKFIECKKANNITRKKALTNLK
jgi:hypothetical protein